MGSRPTWCGPTRCSGTARRSSGGRRSTRGWGCESATGCVTGGDALDAAINAECLAQCLPHDLTVRTVAERRRKALRRQAEQESRAVVVEYLGVLGEERPRDAANVEDPLQHVGPIAPDHLCVDTTPRARSRALLRLTGLLLLSLRLSLLSCGALLLGLPVLRRGALLLQGSRLLRPTLLMLPRRVARVGLLAGSLLGLVLCRFLTCAAMLRIGGLACSGLLGPRRGLRPLTGALVTPTARSVTLAVWALRAVTLGVFA